MWQASEGGPYGEYPITEEQVEAACHWVARLCDAWELPVDAATVHTHWEADYLHGVPQLGKWDITVLPWDPDAEPDEVGPYLRETVLMYLEEIAAAHEPEEPPVRLVDPSLDVQTPPLPDSLRDPAEILSARRVLSLARESGVEPSEVIRAAQVLLPIFRRVEASLPWWSLAVRGIRIAITLLADIRGLRRDWGEIRS